MKQIELSAGKTESKKNWAMTSGALSRLLEWLDEGDDSGGQKYLEMRRRLVAYFDRKNCLTAHEYADETLNRVARRLEEAGTIESETPAKYCFITARFVFMEHLRRGAGKTDVPLDETLEKQVAITDEAKEQTETREKMLDCLEKCAAKLDPANRDLIFNYYLGEEQIKIKNRRALAERLDVSPNALSIRACRIREKLEICINKCVAE